LHRSSFLRCKDNEKAISYQLSAVSFLGESFKWTAVRVSAISYQLFSRADVAFSGLGV